MVWHISPKPAASLPVSDPEKHQRRGGMKGVYSADGMGGRTTHREIEMTEETQTEDEEMEG